LPESLTDLREFDASTLPFDDDGDIADAWERPLRYSVEEQDYLVVSYGRDGRAGGVGLDADLSNKTPDPKHALPTFRQFFTEMPSGGIVGTCAATGILASIVSLLLIRAPAPTTRGTIGLVVKIAITILASLAAALIMSVFHIPTGH
jgi:hypothetical protein